VYTGITKGVEKALVADIAPWHLKGTALGLYSMVTESDYYLHPCLLVSSGTTLVPLHLFI
jgi:hypothetical protein